MTTMLQHTDWLNGRVPDTVRALLRQLVEVVGYLPHHQPLAVITADAVLIAANRPCLDLLGASGDELLGADWDDFMPGWSGRAGSAGGRVEDGPASAGDEPRILAFEDYLLDQAGEPVWVRAVACPVLTPGVGDETEEALCAWVLFVLDRRPGKADADEHRRRAMLDLLLESPSEFVVQLGPDGRVEYVSPSLRHALGVFGDGIEGRRLTEVHELIGEEPAGRSPVAMEQLLGPPYRAEFEMVMTSAGTHRVVQWRFESLLGDGGIVRGVLGVGHDVTERRRAESELGRSEARLRTLVESTNQLVWTTAPGGVIDGPMESWCAFTGLTEDEVRGDGWLSAVHPEDRERVGETWAAALAACDPYDCEYRLRGADGRYRWIEARAVPLRDGRDEPRYFGVGHDISERKEAEHLVRRRARLAGMAASVSARLAEARFETTALAWDFALAELGRHLGADRVGLLVLTPDGSAAESVRAWRRDTGAAGDEPAPAGLERLDWLRTTGLGETALLLRCADDLPAEAETEREMFAQLGLAAALVVPLRQEGVPVGALWLETLAQDGGAVGPESGRDCWTEEDVALVRLVADQLIRSLVWSRDEENLRGVSDCFLRFGPEVEGNLREICRAAGTITSADATLYARRRGDDLVLEAWWNLPEEVPHVTPLDGRLDGDLCAHPDEQVRIVRDLQDTIFAHTSPVIAAVQARTYAGFPVIVGGRAVATLSCLFRADVPLRESQLELLRVLGRAAAVEEERRRALEDRVLGLAQLEQAMERTVATLSAAVGSRDPYTPSHERRVADLCGAIGAELGMDAEDCRLLRLAATVHDIGKIRLPAEILSKPTRLSEAELALIRGHSLAGWELLEPAGLPASVTDAVRQHHERLDGSGYPDALTGDEIGEYARVIAVADVVEAMSSDRPYRPAIGLDVALEEIERGRGVRYDPRVVDACLRLFREKGYTLRDAGHARGGDPTAE